MAKDEYFRKYIEPLPTHRRIYVEYVKNTTSENEIYQEFKEVVFYDSNGDEIFAHAGLSTRYDGFSFKFEYLDEKPWIIQSDCFLESNRIAFWCDHHVFRVDTNGNVYLFSL